MDFSFKGVSASSLGIHVTALPAIARPTKRDTAYMVPGRSGTVHYQGGEYEETMKVVSVYIPYEQGTPVQPINVIREWLTGSGWCTFSNMPNLKFWGTIISEVDMSEMVTGYTDLLAQIVFNCDPYAYRDPEEIDIELTASGTVTNPETEPSTPKVTVTATGDGEVIIGDAHISVSAGVTVVDSEAFSVEPLTVALDVFPALQPGDNMVTISGGVTSVAIAPRWRCLG